MNLILSKDQTTGFDTFMPTVSGTVGSADANKLITTDLSGKIDPSLLYITDVDSISGSTGPADANKIVATAADGKIDPSFINITSFSNVFRSNEFAPTTGQDTYILTHTPIGDISIEINGINVSILTTVVIGTSVIFGAGLAADVYVGDNIIISYLS